ncbi:hypothetical protein IU485_27560 [Nocardia cyriacigeorgica]|uniref:hypothetical protein n=1 Tax=Nocardia cyriacigeorgica TaxID=135487 RepID=UPI00189402A7|nr:hypothetical protein [Nocardia cyriacigeorgica]MBF6085134.1 hypothetical protein [Nocardia cyriacigeorgica]
MTSQQAVAAAAQAYAVAAALDPRIPDPDQARLQAWAAVFDGEDVWPAEAVEAVKAHYRRRNAFPVLPGDIIAAIKAMPPNSSRDRLRAFIARWADYPYSGQIQRVTGMDWQPTYPTPPGIHGDPAAERAYHVAELQAWVRDHWNDILRAGMARELPEEGLHDAPAINHRRELA